MVLQFLYTVKTFPKQRKEFFYIMKSVSERFLTYIKQPTTSDENSSSVPSTKQQLLFGDFLVKECQAIGLADASMDRHGYVMATLPATDPNAPTIGFIAHMDTSPEMSGRHVNPRIIENYAGNDIVLNKEKGIVLSTEEFPELMNYVGQTLITTDGNTLLGADDKAGIAEILTAAEYLIGHPEARVDYIHGAGVAEELACSRSDAIAFLLPAMGKEELFPTVIHDGVLPRKTFSMGEAHDKRFYLEARRIRV